MMWSCGRSCGCRRRGTRVTPLTSTPSPGWRAGTATPWPRFTIAIRAVYSLALRVLGETREAEEVVQDVFAQAWRQAARYDTSRGAVVAWLLMMTRSRAIDRLRARRACRRSPATGQGLRADFRSGRRTERDALSAEQRRASEGRPRQLPLMQRLAIELAFFEGLTHVEIAERLELPLGTIKTRIRLGLMKLKDAFVEADMSAPDLERATSWRACTRWACSRRGAGGAGEGARRRCRACRRRARARRHGRRARRHRPAGRSAGALRARVLAVAGIEADDASGTPARRRVPRRRAAPTRRWAAAVAARSPAGWPPPPRSSPRPAWARGRGSSARRSTRWTRGSSAEDEVVRMQRTLGAAQEQTSCSRRRPGAGRARHAARRSRRPAAAPGATARAYEPQQRHGVRGRRCRRCPPTRATRSGSSQNAAPISAGLADARRERARLALLPNTGHIPTPKIVAVTLEPEGGVPAPTGDRVLLGAVPVATAS